MLQRLAPRLRPLLLLGAVSCGQHQAGSSVSSASAGVTDTPPPAPPAPSGVPVSVARPPGRSPYLSDVNGRALYLLESDRRGTSTCYDACIGVWPPLFSGSAEPLAGDTAVRSARLGVAPRREGVGQAAYNGHPLYYYSLDRAPGDTHGDGIEDQWGEWHLVSPSGNPLEDHGDRRGKREGRHGENRDR